MIPTTPEAVVTGAGLVLLAAAGAAVLLWLAFARPRLGLYAIFALAPTQFVFVPASGFFISPADVFVAAGAAGLLARAAAGDVRARHAIRLHAMLGVMVAGYLVGFVVLDHFSRTLIRVPLAIVPSVLACELLAERKHFRWALGALVLAGLIDAGYGMYFLGVGQRLHPTRFSGMMGVNFSAIVILTSAAIAFARFGRTREPLKLALPGGLALLGLATLSKMGALALAVASSVVVWRVVTPRNRRIVLTAAVILVCAALSGDGVRQRVLARTVPEPQHDGVERTSTDVRVLILSTAWRAFGEQPFVGVGYYNFEAYSKRDPTIHASTAGAGYATHNTYLEVLVEGGLVAFVPFLLHFFAYTTKLRFAWLAILRRQDVIVAASLAGFIVVIVSALAANALLHYLFWSVNGLALACLERLKEQSTPHAAARL